MLTEQDIYYLKSIKRQLDSYRELSTDALLDFGPSIGSEVMYDNLDWLGCFIDQHERALTAEGQS